MSAPVAGQPERVSVIVSEHFGLYKVEAMIGGEWKVFTGGTLDSALGKAAGENVPENFILHAASILRGILSKAAR